MASGSQMTDSTNSSSADFDFGSTVVPFGRMLKPGGKLRYTPTLVCFEGAERGKTYSLTRLETLIGRSSDVDVLIADRVASRRHARVLYKNWLDPAEHPECYLEDMSRNGTAVNGKPVVSRVRLHERDRIQIGSTLFAFLIKDDHEMQLEKSLFEMATRDPLTGLNNRHQFEAQLSGFFQTARRTGDRLALLVVDADRFKSVNDTYGHHVGDQVLVHLARLIRKCTRGQGMCARWGGEEFVVLLLDCDADGARAAGERIRSSVESTLVEAGPHTLGVTVSIGGAVLAGEEEDHESLFRRADQELLQAKKEGRNRVRISG